MLANQTKVKVQLMRRFARVKLYALGLGKTKSSLQPISSHLLPHVFHASYLKVFSICFTEIDNFIDFFIHAPSADYKKLTFPDWTMLISTIIIFPKLHNFTITDMCNSATWQEMLATKRMSFIDRLERLHGRLQDVSTTRLPHAQNDHDGRGGTFPDFFYLFYTVMKLFKDKFVRESTQSQLQPSQSSDSERQTGGGRSKSQCPVMTGEIRNTDYWDLLMQANSINYLDQLTPCDAEIAENFHIDDPTLYFDLSSWIDFPV